MKYFSYLFISLFIFISCISDENSELQTDSRFQRNWGGSFSGYYSGNLSLVIDKTGNIEGNVFYSTSSENEKISGYVFANGRIDLNTRSNFIIHGILNSNNSTGEWSKNNNKGNYTLNKY